MTLCGNHTARCVCKHNELYGGSLGKGTFNRIRCKLISTISYCSGGSRISRRGGVHPLGAGVHPLGVGVDLRCGHFSVKMYAKTKELGPIGGACAGHAPLDPPMYCHQCIQHNPDHELDIIVQSTQILFVITC